MEEWGTDQEVQIPGAERLQRNVHQHVQGQQLLLCFTTKDKLTVLHSPNAGFLWMDWAIINAKPHLSNSMLHR